MKDKKIDIYNGESIILNSKVEKVEVYNREENGKLCIKLILSRYEKVRAYFVFEGVSKFIINFDSQYDLGYIENYKLLFTKENLTYISLDPDNEDLEIESDDDAFIIVAESVHRNIETII